MVTPPAERGAARDRAVAGRGRGGGRLVGRLRRARDRGARTRAMCCRGWCPSTSSGELPARTLLRHTPVVVTRGRRVRAPGAAVLRGERGRGGRGGDAGGGGAAGGGRWRMISSGSAWRRIGSGRRCAAELGAGASGRTGCGSCFRSSPGSGRARWRCSTRSARSAEARAYLAHPLLGARLREVTRLMLAQAGGAGGGGARRHRRDEVPLVDDAVPRGGAGARRCSAGPRGALRRARTRGRWRCSGVDTRPPSGPGRRTRLASPGKTVGKPGRADAAPGGRSRGRTRGRFWRR